MTSDIRQVFYSDRQMGEYLTPMSIQQRKQLKWITGQRYERNSVVVDIGTGTAGGFSEMFSRFQHSLLVGVDISEKSLGIALSRGVNGVCADLDGSNLPIRSESVDVVVMDEIIEHVSDTDGLIQEVNRMLKPGGMLLVSTPNIAAWFNRIALLFGIQPAFSEVSYRKIYGRPGTDVVGHLRLFTLQALVEFLKDNGFEIKSVKGTVFPVLPRFVKLIDLTMALKPSLAGGLVVCARKLSK